MGIVLLMVGTSGPIGPYSDSRQVERRPGRPKEPPQGRRPLLPADLPQALTWLSDSELVDLASAVAAEQGRRNPPPTVASDGKAVQGVAAPAAGKFKPSEHRLARLPPARINAIKAAIKAGVKPSVIARQFGVTQQAIRAALTEHPE
jgi:hypothetical protein